MVNVGANRRLGFSEVFPEKTWDLPVCHKTLVVGHKEYFLIG